MALSDKNIVITPNIGQIADPKIVFSGADASTGPQNITLNVYPTDNGTLSFEGSVGQLFSLTNSLSGTIYSVNDISGIPSIEVLDSGLVKLAQYGGNVLIGTGTDNATDRLQVNGSVYSLGITHQHTSSKTITYTTASTSQVAIDTFATATYRSAKYLVQMTSGAVYQLSEISIIHDGTTAYVVEYGVNRTGADLGSFNATISSGTLSFQFTPTNAVTVVKMHRTLVVV